MIPYSDALSYCQTFCILVEPSCFCTLGAVSLETSCICFHLQYWFSCYILKGWVHVYDFISHSKKGFPLNWKKESNPNSETQPRTKSTQLGSVRYSQDILHRASLSPDVPVLFLSGPLRSDCCFFGEYESSFALSRLWLLADAHAESKITRHIQ